MSVAGEQGGLPADGTVSSLAARRKQREHDIVLQQGLCAWLEAFNTHDVTGE